MFKKNQDDNKGIMGVFAKNSYSTITSIVVIAIVIIANLLLGEIAGSNLKFDISDNSIYEVSEVSKDIINKLESDIEFTIVTEAGYLDETVSTFVEKYADLSSKISIKWIDPVLYPSAIEDYGLTEYSIVVSCKDTGKTDIIPFTEMLYMNEYNYYVYGTQVFDFDAEGQLTSALAKVMSTETYLMYTVSGHGETALGSSSADATSVTAVETTVTDLLDKSSIETQNLNLLTVTEIPDDCDLLAIIAPTTDLTDTELAMIQDFMSTGGDVLFMAGGTLNELPNFESLLTEYGISITDGYIADVDNAYQENAYYIIPQLSLDEELAYDISSGTVLMITTRGFELVSPARESILVSSFINTSSNSFIVTEDDEVQGTYSLAAIASEYVLNEDGEAVESRLTAYGTSYFVEESIISISPSLENNTVFMNAVMANFDGATNVSIEPKSMEETYNAVVDPYSYSILFLFILPASILLIGFVVWNLRRKQ